MREESVEASTGAVLVRAKRREAREARPWPRWPWGVWWAGECLLTVSLLHQWSFVGTHRFYLENRPEAASAGQTARQSCLQGSPG